MKSRTLLVFCIALLVLLLAGGCGMVNDPLANPENNKLTADIGPEYVPTAADRGAVMVDNSVPADEVAPTALTKLVTAPKAKAYGASANLSVPYYSQQTSYWCGPASAQMIQYWFNMGCSQSRIASYCGTTSSSGTSIGALAKWFNDSPMTGYARLPSWWVWEVEYLDSYQEFKDAMGLSFYTYKAPEIWNVRTYPSSTYHLPGYTFNGRHYVTGKGYDSTYAKYNDPWYGSGGGAGRATGKYTMYYCIKANYGLIIY